jgi:hypothetical protein
MIVIWRFFCVCRHTKALNYCFYNEKFHNSAPLMLN